ncbi:hypothetical protein H6F32_06095 [Anabaena sp. FACHB-1237]|uniref:hypothetical protein n=1 Tax=Anabaena sp. FACHB-1237 TaxID=2692769 RepID=UPI0016810F26|nr:hypothetical protein [Anabaena sp. FACHB-1237]MBD2137162.1 hypothetical protein [Anabaena sp. FACHB-1237]
MNMNISILLILIILLLGLCLYKIYNYYLFSRTKLKVKKIVNDIDLIEMNPEDVSNYDRFIKIWKKSGYIEPKEFVNKGYYHRILRICEENSSNVQSWQLFKEVFTECLVFLEDAEQSETLKLLMNILSKEFNNPPIKEKIIRIVMLLIHKNKAKMQFISHWFSRTIMILDNIAPNTYMIDLPVRIYNLAKYHRRTKVNIDLISLEILDNGFKITKNTIIHEFSELFEIFLQAVENHEAQISINLLPRKLLIYDFDDLRMSDIKYLQSCSYQYIKIEDDLKKVDSEITKTEFLINMLERSGLDQYQNKIDRYQRHLNLLSDTSLKGTYVKNKSSQFMQDCMLSIYLGNIEPNLLNLENKTASLDDKYESLQKDYDFFQSMIEQCNQIEYQSHAIV